METKEFIALFFTRTHEWISFDSKSGLWFVGITDYAQRSLGKLVYYETSVNVGDSVYPNTPIAVVESVKMASDVFAGIGGVVRQINSFPDISAINNDAKSSWMVAIEIRGNISNYKDLISNDEYEKIAIEW